MYPRLLLAKDLLSDDGVIFISIDDNEQANLKLLCDSVFGEENFVANVILINNIAGRSDSKHIAKTHEYVLCYQKTDSFISNGLPLSKEQLAEYKYEDNEGKYRLQGIRKRGSNSKRSDRPNLYYPVYFNPNNNEISVEKNNDVVEILPKLSDGSDGCWRWGIETFKKNINYVVIKKISGRNEYDAFEKVYLSNNSSTKLKSLLLNASYTTDTATTDYKSIMEENTFTSPKSAFLLSDIIMDFFSGSASTAQAVMKNNADFNKHNKFIMVQLPEKTPSDSEANKAGYATIDQIGQERIRRAAKKIREDIENQISTKQSQLSAKEQKLAEESQQKNLNSIPLKILCKPKSKLSKTKLLKNSTFWIILISVFVIIHSAMCRKMYLTKWKHLTRKVCFPMATF